MTKNPRLRPLVYAVGALVLVWVLVWGGFRWAENSKVTVAKLAQYVDSVDLSKLSADDRAKALKRLQDMINALSPEDRRQWRAEGHHDWFAEMTEAERGEFIDAIMPTGIKQMLDAFTELPEDKRKKVVDNAIRNLRMEAANAEGGARTNRQDLSPELEQKVRAIGLKTLYTQGSPQTKAELAPFVEELQHQIQSGRGLR